MIENAIGFVLAGGQSSRMGTDKALVELDGRPLIARALDCLRDAGLDAKIAGARSELDAFAPVVLDAEANRGPLGGICAALAQCSEEIAIFISVDMPLFPAFALGFLANHAATTGRAVTLFSVNGFPQSFPAAVRRELLPALRAELEHGAGGCIAAFHAASQARSEPITVLPVEALAQSGHVVHPNGLPPSRWFANVNTQQDLKRAAAWLGPEIA